MRYRYRSEEELKDSGVEWIGKIPKDWEVGKFKYSSLLYTGNSIKDNEKDNYTDSESSYPYISTKDINIDYNTINYDNGMYTKVDDKTFKIANKDSILICIEGGSAGRKISYLNQNVSFVNKLCCIQSSKVNSKFQYYYCNSDSFKKEFSLNMSGLIGGVSVSALNNFRLVNPSLFEQEKIANFLDEKTSQFDLIISKKEKLIERLEEAKKSLISEVVTGKVKVVKTDDGYELIKRSSEEMKDSGIEWLGEIPKDWEVKKLKYIATINPPKSSVKKFVDEDIDVSFVPMDSVRLGNIKLDKTKKISEVIDGYTLFEDNDIVMAKVTPCFENRNIAICKGLKNKIGFGSSELNTIRVYENKDIKFMFYHLQEQKFMDTATYQMTGAGGLKRVPTSFLLNAQFTYPSDNEKEMIVSYLENYIDKIDNISEKTKEQIEKLKEAKQSLISEAVTGKIEILD